MFSCKILIVYTETVVIYKLQEVLEDLGHEVSGIANSVNSAIKLIESSKPDLVIVETQLLDKISNTVLIEQIQSVFMAPVIFFGINESQLNYDPAKKFHPYGYIYNPFKPHIIASTIENALFFYKNEMGLRQEVKQLQEQLQAKSQQIAMLAHEFGNPLAFMQTSLDLLQAKKDQLPQQKQQKHLNYIQIGIQTLKKLVEDMFLLESIQSLPVEASKEWLDVLELCQELIEVCQINSTHDCKVEIAGYIEDRLLFTERYILWHALSNLLANAIKYSPATGEVKLEIFGDSSYICFQIEDNGIGIPDEALANVFQPFRRAANVGKIPGKGLGLAIVKRCIDKLGGEIDVFSQIGEGTTFKVSIPR